MGDDIKRATGRYFTQANPFALKPFRDWARRAGLAEARILEPFAGSNNLIRMLKAESLCGGFSAYDILPAARGVKKRDTLARFPTGFDVCVSNPPWLAKNSATRRGLPYPDTRYDDLYKHCLRLCLDNCDWVAAILPASFLQSRLFRARLQTYILLHDTLFTDTENPVCLSLFGKGTRATRIYYDNKYVGALAALEKSLPRGAGKMRVRFNAPDGQLGFVSFDDTRAASIRFCDAREIAAHEIKVSSRFFTRIDGAFGSLPHLVGRLNDALADFRHDTKDVFLTPFKGLRADGLYRRRMDFSLARRFVNAVA